VVYTDPGRYGVLDGYEARDGDVVLVTHDHHYDPDGIDRVAGADATVVVFEAVDADRIDRPVRPVDELDHDVRRVAVGDSMTLLEGQVSIDVTPAQNHLEDGRDSTSVSHPPGFGCGYRFTIAETHVFWPGDTDLMETFADLDVDLLLANIGGSVVMDRHDAVILAEWLDPGLVVPIHYDTIEMLEADARSFAADVAERSIPVALDEGDH
ncbi:MAG: MBL fold metallo-hydrolase, partial [Halobacteriota archaeon]